MLITLAALGSGPASFLGRRFSWVTRFALAPVFGFCVGTAVFTTLIWFTAARHTYWLLPLLALASVTVAAKRTLASEPQRDISLGARAGRIVARIGSRDAIALALVSVLVALPMDVTLHERHSVGPTGFAVWDSVDYVAEPDGMAQQSLPEAVHSYSQGAVIASIPDMPATQVREPNFALKFWGFYATGDQNLGAAPLSAALNEVIGLHGSDTQTSYLIAFLIMGALGVFGAVRYFEPKPRWVAPMAGVLFAGPFYLQLVADSSQAAIIGLGLTMPIAALSVDVLREYRPASIVLLALFGAGLMTVYPLFVPLIVASALVVLAVLGTSAWLKGRLDRRSMLRAVISSVGLVVMVAMFNLVSFARDLRYWGEVLHGTRNLVGLPQYHLPYSVLPGWLLQTREFYSLTELGSTTPKELLIGVVVPLVLMAVVVAGLRLRRKALVLLPLVLICLGVAEYTNAVHHCSYCTDRDLLLLAPLGIGLLASGIAALVNSDMRLWRWVGVAVALVLLASVGERVRQERARFADGSYFLTADERGLVSQLPSGAGPVQLEGFGTNPAAAPGELPFAYTMLGERDSWDASIVSEYNDYNGLAYMGGANPDNPLFKPAYKYVLTRLGGVQTDRRVLARKGSLALEERVGLDATVVSGIAMPLNRLATAGLPWVEGPLHLIVVGAEGRPAWVSLVFHVAVPVSVPPQQGVRAVVSSDGVVTACVRAVGVGALRRASIEIAFSPQAGVIPDEEFAVAEPPQGVQLTSVRAVRRCSLTSAD